MLNDRKLPLSLRDDIFGAGNRIEMNRKSFQRARFRVSNGLSFVDRKLMDPEL